MSIKLIDVSAVPEDQVGEFLKRWNKTTQVYARTERFIDTHIHRNTWVGNLTFNSIKIADWASDAIFVQAHRDYGSGEESIPGITFHPAVFEEIIMTRNLIAANSAPDGYRVGSCQDHVFDECLDQALGQELRRLSMSVGFEPCRIGWKLWKKRFDLGHETT